MPVSEREVAVGLINSMAENKLPIAINMLRRLQNSYTETQPDEWDIALLRHAAQENDGTVISLEDLAKDLGIAL